VKNWWLAKKKRVRLALQKRKKKLNEYALALR
jgi:hypothetical protein